MLYYSALDLIEPLYRAGFPTVKSLMAPSRTQLETRLGNEALSDYQMQRLHVLRERAVRDFPPTRNGCSLIMKVK